MLCVSTAVYCQVTLLTLQAFLGLYENQFYAADITAKWRFHLFYFC